SPTSCSSWPVASHVNRPYGVVDQPPGARSPCCAYAPATERQPTPALLNGGQSAGYGAAMLSHPPSIVMSSPSATTRRLVNARSPASDRTTAAPSRAARRDETAW